MLSSLSPPARAKPWKELIDVHENSGSNTEKKKPSRARVSGNSCNHKLTYNTIVHIGKFIAYTS